LFPNTQEERRIESQYQIEVPDSFFEFLNSGYYNGVKFNQNWSKKNPQNKKEEIFFKEFTRMQKPLTDSVEKIVRFFRYFLNENRIKNISYGATFWSLDGNRWTKTDTLETLLFWKDWRAFIVKGHSLFREIEDLQKCVDLNIEPFLAFDYIYQAENFEDNPRRQWILTTLALEYAIKEFLVGRDAIFESFVIEETKPERITPMLELYSRVYRQLEKEGIQLCFGIKKIGYAFKIRNFLIHRPKDFEIEPDEISMYMQLVNFTVCQLFAALYKDFPYHSDMISAPKFGDEDLWNNLDKKLKNKKRIKT
jgi:hypothetical protein